jgi:hypothetical protein
MNDAGNTAQNRDRITATLTPKASAGLASLRKRTGLSKTDLVNRAIGLYDLIDSQAAAGAAVLVRAADGTLSELMLL